MVHLQLKTTLNCIVWHRKILHEKCLLVFHRESDYARLYELLFFLSHLSPSIYLSLYAALGDQLSVKMGIEVKTSLTNLGLYIVHGFWPESGIFVFHKKKDTVQRHISRGAEWSKFQLHSTFQRGVKRPQTMSSILVKTTANNELNFGQNDRNK